MNDPVTDWLRFQIFPSTFTSFILSAMFTEACGPSKKLSLALVSVWFRVRPFCAWLWNSPNIKLLIIETGSRAGLISLSQSALCHWKLKRLLHFNYPTWLLDTSVSVLTECQVDTIKHHMQQWIHYSILWSMYDIKVCYSYALNIIRFFMFSLSVNHYFGCARYYCCLP